MCKQTIVLVLALVFGFCLEVAPLTNVWAQGVDEEIFFLNLPVVTATMNERELRSAPSQVYSWGSEDIWRYGIMDINDLLANTPGWFVGAPSFTDYPGFCSRGYHMPSTGLAQAYILFMEDFLRFNEITCFGTFYDESLHNLDQFERVEVINGPGGALYGDNAVAGVVNAISKKLPSEGKNTWTSQTSYESNWNRWRASLGYSGKLTKNVLVSMMLHQTYADTVYEHGIEIGALSNKELRCIERTPWIYKDTIPWSETGNKYDLPEYDISMNIYNDFNLRLINNAIARQGSVIAWNWVKDTNEGSPWRVFCRRIAFLSYEPEKLKNTLNPVLSVNLGKFYDQRVSTYYPEGTITDKLQVPPGTNWKARNEESLSVDFQCKPYHDKNNNLLWKMNHTIANYHDLYLRQAGSGTSMAKDDKNYYELSRYAMLAQWENFSLDNIILTTGLRFDYNKAGSKKITDKNLADSIKTLTPRLAVNWTPTGVDSLRFIYAQSGRQVPASEFEKGGDWAKKDVTEDIELNYSKELSRNSFISSNIFYMNSPSTYVLSDPLGKRVEMKSKGVELLYKHNNLLNKGNLESSLTYWHPEIQELEDKGMNVPNIPKYILKLKWDGELLQDKLNYSLLY
ncbi:MAG: TonB-dependent receptor [Candidatus Desantisbacteria bacterium]